MRVIVVGQDTPGSLYHSYVRAFHSLGADVRGYVTGSGLGIPGLRRAVRGFAARALNRRIVPDIARLGADLILVLKGEALAPETVAAMRRATGATVVNFYPDDPFPASRVNQPMYGVETLAAYDACFTFARHLIPAYRAIGAGSVHYLPFATDPAMHRPLAPRADPDADVIFVGNLDRERIRWLEPLAGVRLAIYGERLRSAIPAASPLRRARLHRAVYGEQLPAILSRGAISLNIMREQNRFSHNMRTFESPACGAFTLSQRTPELSGLFTEGEEIACVGTPDELEGAVRYWLQHQDDRRRIAEAGARRAHEQTYRHRALAIWSAVAATAEVS